MKGKPLATAVAAAQAFVDTKPAADEIAVSTFASAGGRADAVLDRTTDADAALRSIAVDAHAGTRMYDDLVLGIAALSQADSCRAA